MALVVLEDAVDPAFARRLIATLDAGDGAIDDTAIDAALGLRIATVEDRLDTLSLLDRYGVQRFDQGDMTYGIVRSFYRALEHERACRPDLRILDLGGGYGRFGLYGALRGPIAWHGIELVPERAAEAERAARLLGLSGLSFQSGDLLTVDWPPADVYCMLNAVLPRLLPPVMDRLEAEARQRRIVVASVSTSNKAFDAAPWLRELEVAIPGSGADRLRMWESVAGA